MLIKHMSQGMSYESFGGDIEVGLSTMYDWESRHDEWREAKEIAFLKAQKYFESRLVAKTSGQKFKGDFDASLVDNSCLIFALKTRFHKTYGEKKELSHSGEVKINRVDIDRDDEGL